MQINASSIFQGERKILLRKYTLGCSYIIRQNTGERTFSHQMNRKKKHEMFRDRSISSYQHRAQKKKKVGKDQRGHAQDSEPHPESTREPLSRFQQGIIMLSFALLNRPRQQAQGAQIRIPPTDQLAGCCYRRQPTLGFPKILEA